MSENEENKPAENADTKFTTKELFIGAYALVAILFTLYNWLFGAESYRGFFFAFGKSLVWPFQIFPVFGEIVGAIVIVIFISVILLMANTRDKK
ncbi:MAG: hypothetical protein Q8Q73_14300 [Stagnimonas sp.]|nr:hypothetical protein [Stagnimonas sp.]